jgi:hypothetical protein
MEKKIQISSIIISLVGTICIIFIVVINILFGFYFGSDIEELKPPSLTIENDNGYRNTLPNWIYTGKDGYKLIFAVNVPEPGDRYSIEENPSHSGVPMMIEVLNPLKKEIYQVMNNIYRDNKDDGQSNVSLSPGKRYGTIMAGNGLIAYEEGEQFINYSVYYTFRNKVEPILPSYGNPYLTYISRKGLLRKPVINIHPLAGGMFSGGGFMNGQSPQSKVIPLTAGKLIGWIGDSELLFSSSSLDKKLNYVDMHDLWRVPVQGVYAGQPQKLCDNVYEPIYYPRDAAVIFVRKEKSNRFSLWKLSLNGKNNEEKITEFNYTSKTGQLPAIAITNWKQNQNFDICCTIDGENEKKSIMVVNSQNGHIRMLVENQNIKGPVISSSNIDMVEGKYILYFSEDNGNTKANIIDNNGKFQSEIYGLLKSAPAREYIKTEKQ